MLLWCLVVRFCLDFEFGFWLLDLRCDCLVVIIVFLVGICCVVLVGLRLFVCLIAC